MCFCGGHGLIESGLHGGEIGRRVSRPRDDHFRERFRDEEVIPGTKGPCPRGHGMEGRDFGGVDEGSEVCRAGLGDHGRAFWAVGGDGAEAAGGVGALEAAEAGGSGTGGGAADGKETEVLNGSGDEFPIEGAGDEDGDSLPAETVRAGEK